MAVREVKCQVVHGNRSSSNDRDNRSTTSGNSRGSGRSMNSRISSGGSRYVKDRSRGFRPSSNTSTSSGSAPLTQENLRRVSQSPSRQSSVLQSFKDRVSGNPAQSD